MNLNIINIKTTINWVIIYFIICGVIPTILDKLVWRNFKGDFSAWINLVTLISINGMFSFVLISKYQLEVNLFRNISLKGILLAFGCSLLFFLLLDNFLDPLFGSIFLVSADKYRQTIELLRKFPIVNFIRICLLAPVVEEIFIRGCILNSLHNKYSVIVALLISSILFAILHFNFVQTLSALICGLILGLLYLNTESLFSCILAHSLYNTISYFTVVLGEH